MPRRVGSKQKGTRRGYRRAATISRKLHPEDHGLGFVRCITGKVGFSEGEARRRLEAYSSSTRTTRPARVYECPACGAWHLTSQERKRAA